MSNIVRIFESNDGHSSGDGLALEDIQAMESLKKSRDKIQKSLVQLKSVVEQMEQNSLHLKCAYQAMLEARNRKGL